MAAELVPFIEEVVIVLRAVEVVFLVSLVVVVGIDEVVIGKIAVIGREVIAVI